MQIGAAVLALALAAATLRRRAGELRRGTRRALLLIPLVVLIGSGTLATSCVLEARSYVSTDNAQIDGDKIPVTASVSGTLLDWRATQGAILSEDQVIGRIQLQGGFGQPRMVIRAPAEGTVVVDNGVEGAFVTAGTQLAVAYDLSEIYVTARIEETDIGHIRVGQPVDLAVDAHLDITFTGHVSEIQRGAAQRHRKDPQELMRAVTDGFLSNTIRITRLDRPPNRSRIGVARNGRHPLMRHPEHGRLCWVQRRQRATR